MYRSCHGEEPAVSTRDKALKIITNKSLLHIEVSRISFLKLKRAIIKVSATGQSSYQFEDYSKMAADSFDPEKKAKRRKEIFPQDCEKAYEMGVRFAKEVNG